MSYPPRTKSNLWFLLPIFFGIFGGIIAFFILRQDDPPKARNCLYLGLVFMLVGIILNVLFLGIDSVVDPSFDVNL